MRVSVRNAAPRSAPSGVELERRQVTVVFSDVVGYTTISERLDAEEVRDITNEIFDAADRIVRGYGGRVDKLLGDAVLVVFGDPVAHEDDAERAVRAVLELHRAVGELSARVEGRIGRSVAMHSGINTGLVITGEGDTPGAATGPTGDAVNLAARVSPRCPRRARS